jgi:transcriptional regulator with XRE-family HTH domain
MKLPRVREWREARGYSQQVLADRADIGVMTVHRLESGGGAFASTAAKLARALNVEVRDLQLAPPVTMDEASSVNLEDARILKQGLQAAERARETVALARHRFPDLTDAELDVLAQYIRYEQDPRAVQVIIRPTPKEGEEPVDPKKVGDALQKMIAEDLLDPEQVKAVAQMALRQTAS